jgi:hypothetical protein
MGGSTEIAWREALYRQMARQPGLPAGLRPEMIKCAERCAGHGSYFPPPSSSKDAMRG